MKKIILITALTFSLSAFGISATEMQQTNQQNNSMSMQKKQEKMLKMHELLHKIMEAKNPKERERLREEHMKFMQKNMMMQKDMKKKKKDMAGIKGSDTMSKPTEK